MPKKRKPSGMWIWISWEDFFILSSAVGPVLLTVANIWMLAINNNWEWSFGTLTILGILLTFGGNIRSLFFSQRAGSASGFIRAEAKVMSRPGEDYESLYKGFIYNELLMLSGLLGFSATERISLYRDEDVGLVMIGRYSENTRFQAKGRGFQKYSQGVLGVSWMDNDGSGFVNDLPADKREYEAICSSAWQMDRAVVRKLNMQSRTICIRPVKDSNKHKIAALVFESTKEYAFSGEEIDSLLIERAEAKRMQLLLEGKSDLIPTLSIASKEGL